MNWRRTLVVIALGMLSILLPLPVIASVTNTATGEYEYRDEKTGKTFGFRESNGILELKVHPTQWQQPVQWKKVSDLPDTYPDLVAIKAGEDAVKNWVSVNKPNPSKTTAPSITLKNRLRDPFTGQEIASLRDLIVSTIPSFLVNFIGFISLMMFFLGAVRYLWAGSTSIGGGNDGKQVLADAKTAMVGAIIGLVISLLAFGILATLKRLIGA